MSADDIVPIASRADFIGAVRNAIGLAEQSGARELVF